MVVLVVILTVAALHCLAARIPQCPRGKQLHQHKDPRRPTSYERFPLPPLVSHLERNR